MKKKLPIKVEPSILSGDFGSLAAEAKRLEQMGADGIHIDVMDGHFVPNLTLGPRAVAAINQATHLFLDVHIMIYNPFDYIERFIEAGADRITFHFEATEEVEETLEYIRKCNVQAGLAFSPETTYSMIPKYLTKCDALLIMTVNPGFGGQSFMSDMVEKIRFAREVCDQLKIRKGGVIDTAQKKDLPPFEIQVDGGIDEQTAKICVEAGANSLVSGHYLFNTPDMKRAIQQLQNL
jgi:ribulose-phosphate 3-epimerase